MKNIFRGMIAVLLVAAGLFVSNGVAQAERVQIYDGNVKDILNEIRESANGLKKYNSKYANFNLAIRGTHYWNDKNGLRYCESHFGDSDKNRLIFQVNNNGAVSSAWIIMQLDTLSGEMDKDGMNASGLYLVSILYVIGMSKDERDIIMDGVDSWANTNFEKALEILKALRRDNYQLAEQKMNEVEKTKNVSVWCAKSKRYINVQASLIDLESDDSTKLQLYISAHT